MNNDEQNNECDNNDRYSLEAHEIKAASFKKKALKVFAIFILIAAAVFAVVVAWDALRPPDIASYAQEEVQLIGLQDEPLTITAEQLSQLDCNRVSARGTSDKVGQGQVVERTAVGYGPTLNDVLAQWGYQLSDFRRIVFRCKDSYETAILPNSTLDGEVYISIASGKDALPDVMQPMRLLMPEMPPGQWVYGIETIIFEKG